MHVLDHDVLELLLLLKTDSLLLLHELELLPELLVTLHLGLPRSLGHHILLPLGCIEYLVVTGSEAHLLFVLQLV